MKTIRHIIIPLLAVLMLSACSKDGDTIYTAGLGGDGSLVLLGSGDAVLDKDHTSALALTLNWTDNSRPSSSDSRVQLPIGTTLNTLEFALTDDFAQTYDLLTQAGTTSMQFTAKQLNALAGRLGMKADQPTTLYVRLRAAMGSNIDPQYSNTYTMSLTPYFIDMSIAYALDADRADTGITLRSPQSNGVYSGFIGASGWWNWWLQEGDGTTWGNLGVEGKPFYVSSESDSWNFWYPAPAGCYYTTVDTKQQVWTALHIPQLTVSGDLEGEMTYDRKQNQWTLTTTAASAGTATLRIGGTGKLYNVDTQTDDDKAIDTPVGFTQDADGQLLFSTEGETGDLTVEVPAAGTVTLTLNLSDPSAWTLTVAEGEGEGPVETPQRLYVLGNDDTWNYDQWLTLYNEDDLCYAAAVNFHSSWGYYFSKELNDWININQDPESEEMKLAVTGSNDHNIAQPGTGLYVTIASLKWMSYWYPMTDDSGTPQPITSVAIGGFNASWDSLIDMQATETPGVYTATVTASSANLWGVQIYLNGSWENWFGTHADGTLRWGTKEDGTPATWEAGHTYTFTVDLCHGTYTLTE